MIDIPDIEVLTPSDVRQLLQALEQRYGIASKITRQWYSSALT